MFTEATIIHETYSKAFDGAALIAYGRSSSGRSPMWRCSTSSRYAASE